MDIHKHTNKLLKNVASLPGSRDRSGGPVIVINPPVGNFTILPRSTSSSDLTGAFFPYEDLVSLLGYLSEIPNKKSVEKGYCILIDGRKTHPKDLKNILRACQQAFYRKIRIALIVQPDKFINQQKINLDLILEGYQFKTVLVSVHKLGKYIDITQLPEHFGGTYPYQPEKWCQDRMNIESVLTKISYRLQDFTKPNHQSAPLSDNEELFREGESLICELNQSANADHQAAAIQINDNINQVKMVASQPERESQANKMAEENSEKTRLLEEHAEGVNSLLDWIEGPGEKWLLTLHEIGESRDEARQLIKEHQQLEQRSKEVITQADDLADLATRLMAAVPAHSITLEKARDQVRELAMQFANRVERQTDMVRQSEHFHSLMSDLSRKTDFLFESLCTDLKISDLSSAKTEKASIEEKVTTMEKIYESVADTGARFVEDLAANEFNPMGRKITRDYSAGIVHIRDQLVAARERRRRCLELVDVRRLKLQQFIQLFTCESDAQQAIKWLEELHETLLKDYNQIGSNQDDLKCLREDRMKLEETARSTYEYGKQLCQVALVLRRSLRMDAQNQIGLNDKLEHTWGHLCRALSENEAKLNVTEAFNTTIVEVNRRIQELDCKLKESLNARRPSLGHSSTVERLFSVERRRLTGDIQELRHIADMLTAQINANHSASVESRQAAISGIHRKVDSVEQGHRRMESLFTESPHTPIREGDTIRRNQTSFKDQEHTREFSHGVGSIRLSDTESYL